MSNLWLLVQNCYLRIVGVNLRWRLRRREIDPDAIPGIQELRRRWDAGEEPSDPTQTPSP